MASISSSIELYDRMSAPLQSIMMAINMTIASMQDMQSTMNAGMDTSSLDAARSSINQANDQLEALNQTMHNIPDDVTVDVNAVINQQPQIDVPDRIQVPIEPVIVGQPEINTPGNLSVNIQPVVTEQPVLDVPDDVTVDVNVEGQTASQQIADISQQLQGIIPLQNAINDVARNTYFLPDETQVQLNDVNSEIRRMQVALQYLQSNPFNLDSSFVEQQIQSLREHIEQTIHSQEQLNQAMGEMPSQMIQQAPVVENPEPVVIPVQWETSGLEVFNGTGIERFQQEVASTNQMLDTLSNAQNQIAQRAASTDVFSDNAINDMNSLNQRIQAVQTRIQQIERNRMNLGTDTANSQLEQLRGQLNQAVTLQQQLNRAVDNMDVESANVAYNQLSQSVANTERFIRDNANAQGHFNEQVQQGVHESNQLVDTIKNLAAAYLTIQTLGKIVDVSDELVQTQSRIGMMNASFNQQALEAGKTTSELLETQEVMQMIYVAAQDARGSFGDMADIVARFGNNAGDAFSNQEEVVAFANIVQKQMTIAGAGTTEASNAMLQLSQALGSGVLRGDELNSIFEQAPNLIKSIADYLDVSIGAIREMASEGELTADIVKSAIFASADEVNAKFEQMPMTWGQVWQSMENSALMAFQPVLQRINELANDEGFQTFVDGAVNGLATVATAALEIFGLMAEVAGFVADNWSILEPIVTGLAIALGVYTAALILYNTISGISAIVTGVKAAAQYGFNAALLACPITWIIIAIIAVIALIFAVCSAIAKMTGIANTGFGVITGGVNVVIQFFKNLGLEIANIALGIGNALVAVASNMMTAFHNAICSVQAWFYGLLSDALTVIAGIAEALNKLPFVEFDYSGITSAADDYAAKQQEANKSKEEYKSISDAFNEGMSTFDTFQDGWVTNAFNSGAAWGDGVANDISSALDGFGTGDIDLNGGVDTSFLDSSQWEDSVGNNSAATADNTGAIADSVDISNENLKYLRDVAETEAINRFTTAQLKVDFHNESTIKSDLDIDGIVEIFAERLEEELYSAAEGVHF